MNTPTHDCQHDEELLLDLVCGALSPAHEQALRASVVACESCSASLGTLELGMTFANELPMEEPDLALDAIVLEAARAAASACSPRQSVEAQAIGDAPSLLERFIEGLRSFVTLPQVAMVTVMLLVVAIGMLYVPTGGDPEDEFAEHVMTRDPEAATSPPVQLARAEIEAEAAEAPNVGLSDTPNARRSTRPFATPLPAEGSASRGRAAPSAREEASAGPLDVSLGEAVGSGSIGSRAGGGAPAEGRAETQERPGLRMAAAAEEAVAEEPSAASQPAALGSLGAAGDVINAGVPAGAPPPLEANAARADQAVYEEGMQSYRQRRYPEAITALDAVVRRPSEDVRSLLPSALHHLARSHRANNACGQAVLHYESLLRRFASYSQAPRAMVEAADCYRRLGRVQDARRLLEQARTHASTQSDATRELRRLETGTSSASRPARRQRSAAPDDSYQAPAAESAAF